MNDWMAKARKFAGIVKVPSWREALRRHRVAAGVEHARVLRNLGQLRWIGFMKHGRIAAHIAA